MEDVLAIDCRIDPARATVQFSPFKLNRCQTCEPRFYNTPLVFILAINYLQSTHLHSYSDRQFAYASTLVLVKRQ